MTIVDADAVDAYEAYEAYWFQMLGEHEVALAVCGGVLMVAATCVFVYNKYSLVGLYPDVPPAWGIWENISKHHADLENAAYVAFTLGSDMMVLSLFPQLVDPSHAIIFFIGVLGLCCIIAIGFGHVVPHACRMIHGYPAKDITVFRGDCVFLDFTVPISEMCVKGLAQISCFSIYIVGLYRSLVFSSHGINLVYWAVSLVAVQFYMINADRETSRRCYMPSAHLIEGILTHLQGYTCFVKTEEGEWICPSRPIMLLRGFLHFLLNGLGFIWIVLTVPVLVAKAHSPLDFILNLYAVTFLTQLDDVNEEKIFLIRFEAVADGGPFETRQESLSVGIPLVLDVGSDQQSPLMELPSLLTERGSTKGEMNMRVSSLELENLELKSRLAALEAKIGS